MHTLSAAIIPLETDSTEETEGPAGGDGLEVMPLSHAAVNQRAGFKPGTQSKRAENCSGINGSWAKKRAQVVAGGPCVKASKIKAIKQ